MKYKSKMYRFLLQNWLSILGLAIGVLGIGLSVYFYKLSTAERVPVFLIDPVKTRILDSTSFPTSTLKVLRENNTPVNTDVTSLRFYFWNDGKLPIKAENVLQQLVITLSDPNSEILDYKILKASRPDIVLPNIKTNERNPSKSLTLSFNILEASDGFACQIIFAGNPSANVDLSGAIEGVKVIQTNAVLSSSQFWRELGKFAMIILGTLLGMLIFAVLVLKASDVGFGGDDKIAESFWGKFKYHAARIVVILFFIGFLGFPIGMVIYTSIQGANEQSRTSIIESVPASIRP
jgi:hypothetical protein